MNMISESSSESVIKTVEDSFTSETYKLEGLDEICGDPEVILHTILIENLKRDTITDNLEIQCNKDRKRSLQDLYKIMKYYYPEVTLIQLRQLLINLLNKTVIVSFVCHDINRRVYFLPQQQLGWLGGMFSEGIDEFSLHYSRRYTELG